MLNILMAIYISGLTASSWNESQLIFLPSRLHLERAHQNGKNKGRKKAGKKHKNNWQNSAQPANVPPVSSVPLTHHHDNR